MSDFNGGSFSQASSDEKTLINKLESLSMEGNKDERHRLSSELFKAVSDMIADNQAMKEELVRFVLRMKDN